VDVADQLLRLTVLTERISFDDLEDLSASAVGELLFKLGRGDAVARVG
jgi:hypothetical protein